jgi:Brp/Blh family beta-carotene 15,15'-monooxygenase
MPVLLHRTLPWIFAGLMGVSAMVFPQYAGGFAALFFLSSAVILGVPHGACDPWVPGWFLHRPSPWPFLALFCLLYLAISFLYLLAWKAAPFPATVFFLLLTAWHWGTADASLHFFPGLRWLSFGLGRGLWIMLAPFAFHTFEAWRVVLLMAPSAGPVPSPAFFQGLLVLPLLLTLASRPGKVEWVETGLLGLLLAFTPPLVGVGTYFIAFHAWRHLLRLAEIRDQLQSPAPPRIWLASTARLLWFAIPLTVATLAFLPALPAFLGLQPVMIEQWVGTYLILLAVLTLPHAILVGWVDWKTFILKR